jgi:hypothetical protein
MKIEHQIDQIINAHLPAIFNGEETLESILLNHPQIADQLRPRLEAALWLRQAARIVEPRPGFVISSRKYLEAQIESVQPHGFWHHLMRRYTPQRWIFNIASPILVFLLLVMVINNLVLLARLSIPGDTLYSTKLYTEDVQLALTINQTKKADLLLQFSRERTIEFIDLVLQGDYEYLPTAARRLESEITATLYSLEDTPIHEQANEQPMMDKLRETLTNEIFILNMLKWSSPPSALSGIELAIQVAQSGISALH